MDSLRHFDLHLLAAFDILVAERSVTAAARRMGIGQPARSNALSRLRNMLGDPLLVRTSSGLRPTRRTLDFVEPVSRILTELREEVFSTRAFDPGMDERTFRIGVSDQAEAAIMQDVLQVIRRDAPRIHVVARLIEMSEGSAALRGGAALSHDADRWRPPRRVRVRGRRGDW